MISYGQIVWRTNLDSWLNPERLVKRIKLLHLVGKEIRRYLFLKVIKEKDQTTEMKEDRIIGMIEDLITSSKEDQTEDLILKGIQ